MLKIRIIVVGRTRSSFLREGEAFYIDRLRNYAQLEWVEVKPAKIFKGRPEEAILKEESEAIQRRIQPRDHLVALDRLGHPYDSEALAAWFCGLSGKGIGSVTFMTGGPLGLFEGMLKQAKLVLSLSQLTLTHEMTRLILLEQVYRALTILKGEKYHK